MVLSSLKKALPALDDREGSRSLVSLD